MSTNTPTNQQIPTSSPPSSRTSANVARAGRSQSTVSAQGIGEEVNDWQASYTDSSSSLFSLYLSHAEKDDKDQAEGWKAGADGILVFTGLFATALATFLIDSYKSLLPDSAANTVILLAQISRQLDGSATNETARTQASIINAALGEDWQPPVSAILVNVLWFLSLVISLFCALLATLQQRWARRYLRLTQPHVAIHKRAAIRSFFAEGVARFHVSIAVEAIPALLHVSVFLFLTGLVVSLFTIHHTVAYVVLAATSVCASVYMAITVLPAVYHDSPYTSPFSAPAWYISRKAVTTLLNGVDRVADVWRKRTGGAGGDDDGDDDGSKASPKTTTKTGGGCLSVDMTKAANDAAMKQLKGDKGMLARALGWTLDKMDEEGELVEFVAGIPGFHRSIEVKEAVSILEEAPKKSEFHFSLWRHIMILLIRAKKPRLMPDCKVLPDSVREYRIKYCIEAMYYLPLALKKLLARAADQIDNKKVVAAFQPMLQSIESSRVAERLSVPNRRTHQDVTIGAQCVAAVNASRSPYMTAEDQGIAEILRRQLNINEADWQGYLQPVDSLLLRNVNCFLERTALPSIGFEPEKFTIVLSTVRLIIAKLKVQHAMVPGLRDEFERLRTQFRGLCAAEPARWDTRKNARELLSVLANIPAPAPPPDNNAATIASPTSVHPPPPPPRMPSPPPPLPVPVLQHSDDDAYAPMLSPSTPIHDTYPLVPMPQTPDHHSV